jgi:CDP-6-deoxy-D-xylo-4-hexulose-3-dehydrase
MRAEQLRAEILALVNHYYQVAFPDKPFSPGETIVPVSGRVFDADDLAHLVDSALDFWLTTGRFAEQFEREIDN